MSRPSVTVVMPFAGDAVAAREALRGLRELRLRAGDELILSDNTGSAPPTSGVTIVRATAERSPAHARNAGAQHARGDWILFLDADCRAPESLLDAYFASPVDDAVGALAGEVVAESEAGTLAGRYGAQRNFLSQAAHLAHPFRPRAAAANLLVRRAAFAQVGGFLEGLRAAEDTDFTWRLQEAGWRLELRADAVVAHRYRTSVAQLRRQWRGYAAGRAWLARRYPGFVPEPALQRVLRRTASVAPRRPGAGAAARARHGADRARQTNLAPAGESRLQRAGFAALDAVLSLEELAGFALSNRPDGAYAPASLQAVLIAERFPAAGDPLVELARALGQVRVEAAGRPREIDLAALRELPITYREDDGLAQRLISTLVLAARHPARVARDISTRRPEDPPLRVLAPLARRLQRDPTSRVLPLGGQARATAQRVARMAGRRLDDVPGADARGGSDGRGGSGTRGGSDTRGGPGTRGGSDTRPRGPAG